MVLTRRRVLIHLAVFGAGSLLAACTPAPGAVAPPGPAAAPQTAPPSAGATTTVVYAVSSNPATLNPLLDNSGASQTGYELIFESLVKPDPRTGTPIPSLAQSWDQSPDGLTWT